MNDLKEQFETIKNKNKFLRQDQVFFQKRKDFSEYLGFSELYSYIDQFGLYVGTETMASKVQCYEFFKLSLGVPGHIFEFGVWHGSNLLYMAKLLRLMQPNSVKNIFGFDNFSGLPTSSNIDGKLSADHKGRYIGDEEVLMRAIELFEFNDTVHLIKGDANKTIPEFEKSFPEALVSFAWLDFDLYDPCIKALDFLAKRLSIGGVIVFDEAMSSIWPGETVALLEYLSKSNFKFEMRSNQLGRQPVMCLIRKE
jgi:hypothetical protein